MHVDCRAINKITGKQIRDRVDEDRGYSCRDEDSSNDMAGDISAISSEATAERM